MIKKRILIFIIIFQNIKRSSYFLIKFHNLNINEKFDNFKIYRFIKLLSIYNLTIYLMQFNNIIFELVINNYLNLRIIIFRKIN